MDRSRLSIVHGPANVGNLAWTLSNEMKALGHDSRVVANYGTWLGYPADRILGKPGDKSLSRIVARTANGLSQPLGRDVLHYYFGRSFFSWDDWGTFNPIPFADMRLARSLNKTVVMTYQGCDARIASRSNSLNAVTMCREGGCTAYENCIASYDADRLHTIDVVDQLADLVLYVNPELGRFLPRGSFLPYGNVDLAAISPQVTPSRARPLILHAPSDPHVKGTRAIQEALDVLRPEFDFDFRLVQGLPHEQAMQLYGEADLLIDQVLAGWYGGLGVELMAMGKPVACYIRDEDLGFIPRAMRDELPILRIDPRTLVDDLRRILVGRSSWPDAGRRSREYAMRWHDPRKLARVLLAAYAEPSRYEQYLAEMN